MVWLIIGAIIGVAGLRLALWARAGQIDIRWYVWVLGVIAVVLAALTAMDYGTFIRAMEPGAAGVMLWLTGGPALLLALIAIGLVWWQNRKTIGVMRKS